MSGCRCKPFSSITKKQVMAVTGLLLCGFLLVHLLGNCLLYVGPEAFNTYAHKLITNPLIYPMEAGLALLFLTHLGMAFKLVWENKKARPNPYYRKVPTGRGQTFASTTMPITGMIVLAFLIIHLFNFKYGTVYYANYDGVEMRDLYRTVIEYFQASLAYVVWYVFACLALGIHLSHGVWSAFQTLGVHHPVYNRYLNCLAKIFAAVIAIGFSALPIWAYVTGGHLS